MSKKRKRYYSVVCRCVVCGRPFRASRTDAKHDTPACRKKASRDRAGDKKKLNPPDASQMSFAHLEYLAEEYGSKYDRVYQSWE
jgi:hypothetical protein